MGFDGGKPACTPDGGKAVAQRGQAEEVRSAVLQPCAPTAPSATPRDSEQSVWLIVAARAVASEANFTAKHSAVHLISLWMLLAAVSILCSICNHCRRCKVHACLVCRWRIRNGL